MTTRLSPPATPPAWREVKVPWQDPRTELAFVGSNASRKAGAHHLGAPALAHPGVYSTDPRYAKFRLALAREATRRYPSSVRPDGFAGEDAVTGDFSALLTASGCQMSPATVPMVDRTRLIDGEGLAHDFVSQEHRQLYFTLHELMFSRRRRGAVMRYSAVSSSGNPFFEYDVVWKHEMLLEMLQDPGAVFKLVMADDYSTLYTRYSMLFMSTLVKRLQADGGADLMGEPAAKPRYVADAEYALSGGLRGRRFAADKKLALAPYVEASDPSWATRVRTAYAFNNAVNYLVTSCLVGARDYYLHEYAYTWHHTTPEQIAGKVKGAYRLFGADVTQMDQFYPDFLLSAWSEGLSRYYHPAIAKIEELVSFAAFYAPSPGPGLPPVWAGDPRAPHKHPIRPGLNSGCASNPDRGKVGLTFAYIALIARVWPSVLTWRGDMRASLDGFLRGEHPDVGLLDMSDDAVFVVRDTEAGRRGAPALEALLRSKKGSPYFIIDFEDGIAFLGNVFRRGPGGEELAPVPNPVTYLTNWFCREHSLDSVHNRYWGAGVRARRAHYASSPLTAELDDLVIEMWSRHFSASVPHPLAAAAEHERHTAAQLEPGMSYADRAVLLDPTLLHYRFTARDISPAVLDLTTASIQPEALLALDPFLPPYAD